MRIPRLARDTVLNMLGQGVPLVLAFFAMPFLTRALGAARFGILSLGWVLLGYFTLFDLGLGRALTKVVSERLDSDRAGEIPSVIWTSLAAMLVLGLVGALATAGASPVLVYHILTVPPELQQETVRAFLVAAVSVPVIIATAGFRGLLEARGRFDLANAVRLPLSAAMLLVPLALLPFTHSLVALFGSLLIVRVCGLIAHAWLAARLFPAVAAHPHVRRDLLRPLLTLGGWMTVSNVLSPIMATFDRFLIGSVESVADVGYYSAPFEAVTKLWLLPLALAGVLFPRFAAPSDEALDGVSPTYRRSIVAMFAALFPMTVAVAAFAPDGLRIWLGPEFAARSTGVVRLLAVGVLLNSVAHVPFAMLQARGRPDLTAKLHLAEVVPYGALLWVLIARFGIAGAAAAWTARVAGDTAALMVMGRRFVPRVAAGWVAPAVVMVVGATFLAAAWAPTLGWRSLVTLVAWMLVLPWSTWALLGRADAARALAAVRTRLSGRSTATPTTALE